MAAANLLAALDPGTFPLSIEPSAMDALQGRSGGSEDEVVALRYTFKPASVAHDTPGFLETAPEGAAGSGRVLSFELPTGGSQVFDVREEVSKSRECVLIWDAGSQTFKLHALPLNYILTQNRTLSAQRPKGGFPEAPKKAAPARRKTAGKGVARKSLPAGAAVAEPVPKKKAPPKKAAAKPKAPPKAAAKKRGKAAAPAPAAAKVKSVEIIEDSDDEMDEFANMLGEAMEEAIEEEEEEEVEEEDDDELGGATFAGYEAAAEGEEVEWI